MIRLEILESYTLVLCSVSGRRWGKGEEGGGVQVGKGGWIMNVWPQRKESEWCCAFSTGLWAGWLAGFKVQRCMGVQWIFAKVLVFFLFLPSSLLTRTLLPSA